jgi:hypothetical protein
LYEDVCMQGVALQLVLSPWRGQREGKERRQNRG